MPNYCENELIIKGSCGVLACLAAIKGEPEDGSPIHRLPEDRADAVILRGRNAESGVEHGRVLLGDDALGPGNACPIPWVEKRASRTWGDFAWHIREHFPDAEEKGRRSIQAEHETGCRDWYEWRVGKMENGDQDGHWGTNGIICHSAPLDNPTDARADIRFSTACPADPGRH